MLLMARRALQALTEGDGLRVAHTGDFTARATIGIAIEQALDGHEYPGVDQCSRLLHLRGKSSRQCADEVAGIYPHDFDVVGEIDVPNRDARAGRDDPGLMRSASGLRIVLDVL
jgi:hypothetical protein